MLKKIFLSLIIFILFPLFCSAQNVASNGEFFKARVLEIVKEQESVLPDGTKSIQQNIKLQGLEGEHKGKTIFFNGIGNFDLINKSLYKAGDRVIVAATFDDQGNPVFYITDYDRNLSLLWLFVIFILVLLIVGRWKGLRAAISLVLSFIVILYLVIPAILSGVNPIWPTFFGALAILVAIIYFTEGFGRKSHIAVISTLLSLVITILLSIIFIKLAKLTGVSSEEVSYLVNINNFQVNFEGLLLAGIIIGTLGVLDDVVIAQVVAVEEILKADPLQRRKDVFRKSYEIGVSHISSMANTLFLAYAGASLPLIILFSSKQSAYSSLGQIASNEAIATEVIRTLVGSIGLILAVPIATYIAVLWLVKNK